MTKTFTIGKAAHLTPDQDRLLCIAMALDLHANEVAIMFGMVSSVRAFTPLYVPALSFESAALAVSRAAAAEESYACLCFWHNTIHSLIGNGEVFTSREQCEEACRLPENAHCKPLEFTAAGIYDEWAGPFAEKG
jgi:hypothetical protein